MKIPIALTIAGSDSGGGAGIQADIKTMSALGVYSASVVTALTAQNTVGVTAVHEVEPTFVAEQIDAVCSDLQVSAAKIGMLHRTDVIATVAEGLQRHSIGHIVLDPVMVAKSGDPLLHDDAIEALKSALIPIASIITPNIPEAARLLRRKEEYVKANKEAATERLLSLGCGSILLKGGHDQDCAESTDLYFDGNNFRYLPAPRTETRNTHGTGCSLSSAICAELAKKQGMELAVFNAKQYVSQAIAFADVLNVGTGHGPIHHFHQIWT